MPESAGRTGKPGNSTTYHSMGRTGTPGNKDSITALPSRPNMAQESSRAGRSLRPGNDTSKIMPSSNPASMAGGASKAPTAGVPGKTEGKFNYAESKNLLKRPS